ncbi:protein SRG1-like [Oryza brachyantha]|uniref:Fe2OG dioxygenase domain-containing protein n=1 Tax=Oryza brachyantha TaxID=4533 RepID=J3KZP4_ORYBR|nr:protein SRG1-like [Oryza brachyantha]
MQSLPVPSVQAMVAATGGTDVPPRYLRLGDEAVATDGEAEIPVIDFQRLKLGHGEEMTLLHRACQDWGFFQLINHSVPEDLLEGMKSNVKGFFELPAETKKQFAQERGQLDGYGQLFVVSDDQQLDWADILFLNTQPVQERNIRFWPDQPPDFRSTLDKYSAAVKSIVDFLLVAMSNNLGVDPEVIADKCGTDGIQAVRMNYYPPCVQADKVIGFSPHSDSDLLTLVLQVNEVDGLQIKRNGTWFPVRPLDGAFIVNVGDILQIFTNGRYKSVEHRAVVNTKKERLSVVAFHSPSIHAIIGPLREMVAHEDDAVYKNIDHDEFMKLFFSAKLDGKSFLDRMKRL